MACQFELHQLLLLLTCLLPLLLLLLLQELWSTIADLRAAVTDPHLLEGLARGIGAHHSGLDTRYRQAVEMLFRSKHLQVRTVSWWSGVVLSIMLVMGKLPRWHCAGGLGIYQHSDALVVRCRW